MPATLEREYSKEGLRVIYGVDSLDDHEVSGTAERLLKTGVIKMLNVLYIIAELLVDIRGAIREQTEVIKAQRSQTQQVTPVQSQQQQPRDKSNQQNTRRS